MAKVHGFKHITAESFDKAYQWIQDEGTCCLAYGDWTKNGYELLLTNEQKAMHKNMASTDQKLWCELDEEVIEAMVMLPVFRMIDATTLYWDDTRNQISTVWYHDAAFGIDFSDEGPTEFECQADMEKYVFDFFRNYQSPLQVSAVLTADPNTGMSRQSLTWNIDGAEDFNLMLDLLNILTADDVFTATFAVKPTK